MLQDLWERARRQSWPLVVVGILIGVLIGLILGWRVWPVKWYDTDPPDLREQHKMTYVLMVADSLAVTGNQEVARRRLADLVDQRNSWEQVANLVERVALERERIGDVAAALRVRRLAQIAQLPAPQISPEAPAPKPLSRSARLLIFSISLTAFLAALAILLWYLNQRMRSRLATQIVTASLDESKPLSTEESFWSFMTSRSASNEDDSLPVQEPEELDLSREEEEEPELASDTEWTPPTVRPTPLEAIAEEPSLNRPWNSFPPQKTNRPSPNRQEARSVAPSFVSLGRFEAEYHLGDDDFDRSFSIESPEGEFLGECGVGICDIVRVDTVQQVDAFEIWLFDKGDIRTVSKILVSERAYQDEALKARLSGKGELVQARPGLTVVLQTLSLRVTATVKALEYAKDEDSPDSIFTHLHIELLAEMHSP